MEVMPFNFRYIDSIDRLLLTNLSGAFCTLDSYEQLNFLIDGKWQHLPSAKLDELAAANFVSEGNDRRVRANLLATGLATATSQAVAGPSLFMVVPTLRCDHNCRYCQVARVPVTKRGFDLPSDSISKIIRCIGDIAGPSVKVEFQGGEPLLEFDYVREFVDMARTELADRSLSFVICSALGPLSDTVINWAMKNTDVDFSVSLDGTAATHNTNRPSNFFDTHRNTINGIRRIQESLGPDRISCLGTVTKETFKDSEAFVRSYFDLGLDDIFIRPLSPFGFAGKPTASLSYTADEYFEFYRQCLDHVIDLNRERPFVEVTAFQLVSRIFRHGYSANVDLQSPAGHTFGALVFNYDGNIFGSDESRMLWRTTKAPELRMGDIDDCTSVLLEQASTQRMLRDTFIFATPGCDDCAYQPYCGADPLHHLATQGDHIGDKSQSFFCRLQRLSFDHIFSAIHKSTDSAKVMMSWLTH